MRRMFTLLAATALLAPAAFAQTTPANPNLRVVEDGSELTYQGITIEQLEELDIVHNGEEIGEVDDVLVDGEGKIVAVTIEHEAGFLGLGEREVVMPLAAIQINVEEEEGSVSLTEEQLKALPEWDD